MLKFSMLLRCIFILVLFCLSSACAVKTVVPASDAINYSEQIPQLNKVLQHGDWLVIRGVHIGDNLVASLTNMPLSHAAIYDAENQKVIEATGVGGVESISLQDFMNKTSRLIVIRPIWAKDKQKAQKAVEKARGWVGKGYDYSGLVGLNNPELYYCTELAIKAYQPFEQDPENPVPNVIKPGQMYYWGRIIYDTGPL